MSILARIIGRRPAPPPPPPPPPLRGDLLSLTGAGLAGADLTGEIEVTITVAGRTYAASTTRCAPGEYALHDFREVVADELVPVVADEPVTAAPVVVVPDEPVVVAPDEPAIAAVAVAEAPAVVVDAPAPDPAEIAVVRLPLTDNQRHIVGYELVVDADRAAGAKATAALRGSR